MRNVHLWKFNFRVVMINTVFNANDNNTLVYLTINLLY